MHDSSSKIIYKGVVFNEMKGVFVCTVATYVCMCIICEFVLMICAYVCVHLYSVYVCNRNGIINVGVNFSSLKLSATNTYVYTIKVYLPYN